MSAQSLAAGLRVARGLLEKQKVAPVIQAVQPGTEGSASDVRLAVPVGDDCAAIVDGAGYLLFAIEGFIEELVHQKPWFAGYCGVMVNVSDIYAMGGRPIAVVDAMWSHDGQAGKEVLAGLVAGSQRYGVPIVGGHTNTLAQRSQLAVAILGRATRLLSSFAARPGDRLVMAIDLRGAYEEPYPFWNASTGAPAGRLRGDLELLALLAESGLCDAAKDISMAGALGTALMLLDCSQLGASIDIDAIPRPALRMPEPELLRWLTAFPSYGFVLSVRPSQVASVLAQFARRHIAAATVGEVTEALQVTMSYEGESVLLWDLSRQSVITVPSAP